MNTPAAMLFAARTAAWTLLFGGWLVLGALSLRHGPAGALQFAPLALWLGTVALAQRALQRHPPGPWALRGVLLCAGAVAAAGVATGAWAPSALGWGVLLVAASTVVRRWRGAAQGPAASPRGPALLAALCAAAMAGDPLASSAWATMAALPAVLAAALAAAVPRSPPAPARAGCRSGLFDCALGSPTWAAWATPQSRLRAVAALAMLPMMALLPWMLEACRSEPGLWAIGPRTAVALHLLAMLLPAWWPRAVPAAGVAGLLVAGGVCALALPGGSGLMLGMALQAAAWGCVWREAVVPGQGAMARAHGAGGAGGAGALAVLVLGAGLVAWPGSPATAMAAVAATLGLAAALAWGSARAAQPSAHKRRVTA